MKIIRPVAITDDNLVSSNLVEVPPDAYAAGTTYAAGNTASTGTAGGVISVWESLADANTGNDPASSPDWWTPIGTTYAVYDSGTTYAEGDIVIVPAEHRAYESLDAGNAGNYPPEHTASDPPLWLDLGSTNAWRAFDVKVGSQTRRPGSIEYTVAPGLVAGIALLNVEGVEIQIIMTDPVEGGIYNETISLLSTQNVFDGYSYCFEPILMQRNSVRLDLYPYRNAEVTVKIIAEEGGEAACGEIVIGNIIDLGLTSYGAEIRIDDWSVKERDQFGNFSILERDYSKGLDVQVQVDNGKYNHYIEALADLRATPLVWVPTEAADYSSAMLTYGFYESFRPIVPHIAFTECNLRIEGLT